MMEQGFWGRYRLSATMSSCDRFSVARGQKTLIFFTICQLLRGRSNMKWCYVHTKTARTKSSPAFFSFCQQLFHHKCAKSAIFKLANVATKLYVVLPLYLWYLVANARSVLGQRVLVWSIPSSIPNTIERDFLTIWIGKRSVANMALIRLVCMAPFTDFFRNFVLPDWNGVGVDTMERWMFKRNA